MAAKVKKEAGGVSAEEAIVQLCTQHPEGVPGDHLSGTAGPISGIPLQARIDAINKLLRDCRILMFRKGSQLLYKLGQAHDAKAKGLSAEEALVYQVIKQAGNTGVWTRDMKVRTNLGQPQITKILKSLEAKSLIKSVKNVNNPSRKLYMLFDLEPSTEITGGAWYTDQQLDREFIDVLREACYKLIEKSEPHVNLDGITSFINSKGLARVELRKEDIRTLLDTLICDGRIEEIFDEQDASEDKCCFRPAVLVVPEATAFTSIPCGVCPVIDQCCEGGQISPQTCVYYQTWLEF